MGVDNFKNDWKPRQFVQQRISRILDSELVEYSIDDTFFFWDKNYAPTEWILGNQGSFIKSSSRLADAYYGNQSPHLIEKGSKSSCLVFAIDLIRTEFARAYLWESNYEEV